MCLVLNVLHQDRHCLDNLDVNQTILGSQQASEVNMAHFLLDKVHEIVVNLRPLRVNEELGHIPDLLHYLR